MLLEAGLLVLQVGRAVECGCGAPTDTKMRRAHWAPLLACLCSLPGGRGVREVVESILHACLHSHRVAVTYIAGGWGCGGWL